MYSAEVVSAIARIQCRRRRSDERGTYRRRTASGKGGVWQRWSLRFTANRLSRRKLQAPWTCMCEQTVTLAKKPCVVTTDSQGTSTWTLLNG
jgi:hypothetical protein